MGEHNKAHDRAVWFDIPVADLARATRFCAEVLDIDVATQQYGDTTFGVLVTDSEGNRIALHSETHA